jgi:hypoxanthine-guanine phosphoribosyltransferase
MGAIKDAIDAMNKVVLMNDKVERTGKALSEISKELRDHEGRLIRLETFIEVAKSTQTKLPDY